MRRFNTSGPCDPQKHYTLMREPLLLQGKEHVDNGRFFTIFLKGKPLLKCLPAADERIFSFSITIANILLRPKFL